MECTIKIDTADIDQMIYGMNELCQGLWHIGFSSTAQGILNEKKNMTPEQNAVEFVNEYVELTSGALSLMAAATNVISTALVNGEIEIVAGGEK